MTKNLNLRKYIISIICQKTFNFSIQKSNIVFFLPGIFHWLLGGADIGTSSSNGEQAIRQYKGIQKDGSVTGSKGVDNLNFAIDNAFGGTKKSAGQVFSENLMAGAYMPYGIVEDVGACG